MVSLCAWFPQWVPWGLSPARSLCTCSLRRESMKRYHVTRGTRHNSRHALSLSLSSHAIRLISCDWLVRVLGWKRVCVNITERKWKYMGQWCMGVARLRVLVIDGWLADTRGFWSVTLRECSAVQWCMSRPVVRVRAWMVEDGNISDTN